MLTIFRLPDFLRTPLTTLGNLATGWFSGARYGILFLFVFLFSVESCNWLTNIGMLVLRRRVMAGFDEESSDVSCGNDVQETYLLSSWKNSVDNPGTRIGTLFSVLHWMFLPLGVRCGF